MIRLSFLLILFSPLLAFAQDAARVVKLDWDPLKKAAAYEIEVRGPDSKAVKYEIFEPKWRGELKPGKTGDA